MNQESAGVGLKAPLKFAPIFLGQLAYKSVWLVAVFLPQIIKGTVPIYAWLIALVFASYVVLDIIAIPFSRVLAIDTGLHG